jgi:hypothetical protein
MHVEVKYGCSSNMRMVTILIATASTQLPCVLCIKAKEGRYPIILQQKWDTLNLHSDDVVNIASQLMVVGHIDMTAHGPWMHFMQTSH